MPLARLKIILAGEGIDLRRAWPCIQLWVLATGAFFSLAPLWAPHIRQVWGRNLFGTPDAMFWLGVTLLVSLLAYYLLPDFFISWIHRFSRLTPYIVLRQAVITFSLLSLVFILYWVNQNILDAFLSSADEHSCYFLAECLRRGKLFVEIPPLADFFQVVHVGMKGGKWFSVYPPGWPAIWAVGLHFNIVDWLNPVMSALAIFFFYLAGVRLFSRWAVALGLLACTLSPFFMFTAASYFSHGTCLLCISIFLYAFLRWRESYDKGNDPVGWAVLCGFAVGYGLMTRYLTMAAIVGPFLLYHYLPLVLEWNGWRTALLGKIKVPVPRIKFKCHRLRKSDWIVVGVVAVFMIVILWQNYLVTGKPFKAPNKYDKSWERLGFKGGHYTPVDGFFYVIARVFYLMDWFAPAFVAGYLVLLFSYSPFGKGGLWGILNEKSPLAPLSKRGGHQTQASLKLLFRLTPVFLAFAYFLYYSWGGNQWGPRYWWEGLPFLSIAVGGWITARWNAGGIRMRKFLVVFIVASIASSAVLFVKHADFTEEASRQRRALYDLAERTIEGRAIVFIKGFLGSRLVMAEEDAVRNSPFLDGRILYAHDLGERNQELMSAWPGREYYRGTYDLALQKPVLENLKTDGLH